MGGQKSIFTEEMKEPIYHFFSFPYYSCAEVLLEKASYQAQP